ncbi:hypothetical protein OE88DRAFT_1649635 [Heliocybe sulcata]|uniref:Uncharacterized protein n=1 Tax=Heliocybe sulcata TaxID=5364 RepID=A0A5C3NJR8_9AGAM|nr:hypothetical protein OE88DRAFT_1649635 [Heliocybe sulcata]
MTYSHYSGVPHSPGALVPAFEKVHSCGSEQGNSRIKALGTRGSGDEAPRFTRTVNQHLPGACNAVHPSHPEGLDELLSSK